MQYLNSLTSLSVSCQRGVDLEIEGELPWGLRRLSLATGGWLGMTVPAGSDSCPGLAGNVLFNSCLRLIKVGPQIG